MWEQGPHGCLGWGGKRRPVAPRLTQGAVRWKAGVDTWARLGRVLESQEGLELPLELGEVMPGMWRSIGTGLGAQSWGPGEAHRAITQQGCASQSQEKFLRASCSDPALITGSKFYSEARTVEFFTKLPQRIPSVARVENAGVFCRVPE